MMRIAAAWARLRRSFWFVPLMLILLAVVLAVGVRAIDRNLQPCELPELSWLCYPGDLDGARTLSSMIAGSMISIAGTVFSITIAILVFTSSAFGFRLLRNFRDDRSNQVVLGTFVATFIYCLLVLYTLKADDASVPRLSVTVGMLLGLISVIALIYFIHHVAESIQANKVIASVGRDLDRAINRLFQSPGASPPPQSESVTEAAERIVAEGQPIEAKESGYIQSIDATRLMHLAVENDLRIHLIHRPGHFATEEDTLAFVSSQKPMATSISRQINQAFILGTERVPGQDIEYALHQLVEIALRALSPGINDPFTAITCIDWLGASLNQVAGRDAPSPYRHDREGYLRLVLQPLTFDGLVNAAFDQIRQTGRTSVGVTLRLLETIAIVMSHAQKKSHKESIMEQAKATYRGIMTTDIDESDRRDVEKRYQKVLRAARRPRGSHA